MKTRAYKNGTLRCRTYLKPVGFGYEVGVVFGSGTPAVVGNFTKANEAGAWYAQLNREIRNFSRRYKVGKTFPKSWFKSFLTNHLYHCYYRFCDRKIAQHARTYRTAFNKHNRGYQKVVRNYAPRERKPFLRAA